MMHSHSHELRPPCIRKNAMTAIIAAICMVVAAGPSAAASKQRYTYRVDDSVYGEIGTYSNDVEIAADATTITTEAHIKVSLLGITLYNQEVSRTERWIKDRLVYFHGVTTEDGQPTEVDGHAEADHFVVISPHSKVIAPGTLRSANPWSAGAPGGDTILMPDTGLVEKVHANICEDASIMIDDASMRTRRCQIDAGQERYEVWMDHSGTPVMFNIKDSVSTVTFTLVR